jgi:predicted  nucleic acid-binding Zn-ribbon protein
MAEKLKDIKETASDAVEIIRELGSPEVQESLEKIKETAKTAREVIESFKDPAMVTNIENIRKMTESIDSTSTRMEKVVIELKSSGILDETRETIKSAKTTMSSIGDGKNIGELVDAIKEMLRSISGLMEELKITVVESKKSGTLHNAEEAIQETRNIFTEGE